MNESRRNFITVLLISSVLPSLVTAANGKKEISLVIANSRGGKFWLFDWSHYRLKEIEIPLGQMHSSLELSPGRMLFFEFWGNSILSYDLKTGEKQKIDLAENEFFSGHGMLSPDGQTLFTVEQELTSHSLRTTSRIVMRNPKTLRKIDVLHTSQDGVFHDLAFLGNQLILSEGTYHGTMEAKVHFFDWQPATSQLKKTREVTLPGIRGVSNHFLLLSGGRFLAVPAAQDMMDEKALAKIVAAEKSYKDRLIELNKIVQYRPSPLYVFEPNGAFTKLWPDRNQQLLLHNLSSCRIPTSSGEFLAVTHPDGHSLTIWKDNRLVKTIDGGEFPSGIAYSTDLNELLLVDGKDGRLRFFSAPDFKEKEREHLKLSDGGATHLLTLA